MVELAISVIISLQFEMFHFPLFLPPDSGLPAQPRRLIPPRSNIKFINLCYTTKCGGAEINYSFIQTPTNHCHAIHWSTLVLAWRSSSSKDSTLLLLLAIHSFHILLSSTDILPTSAKLSSSKQTPSHDPPL